MGARRMIPEPACRRRSVQEEMTPRVPGTPREMLTDIARHVDSRLKVNQFELPTYRAPE